ncbi:MAG: HD domain-containing protein [Mycobacteriales bacterium]
MADESIMQLARAYHFAAVRHASKRRKGQAAEPYINHLTEVAELVARATRGTDPDIVIAAVLHDTVEDTDATLEELETSFGERVAGLVGEVTDDKSLPKQTRKDLQVERAGHASRGAQIVKLADKISNLRSLAQSPPHDWDEARRREYLGWACQVVDRCRSADSWLADQFDDAANALRKTFSAAGAY